MAAAGLAVVAACGLPRWPVEGPLASPFGVRWRGILPRIHHGVDISVPEGTPVRAMADGVVRYAGGLGGYGTVVIIDHGRGLTTLYAHLAGARIRRGDRVDRGEVVGISGSTGSSAGAHLHFEIRLDGTAWNPVPLLGGPP